MTTSNSKDYMIVTFRVKQRLYAEFKKAMIDARTTPTANLVAHIKSQVDTYNLPESNFSDTTDQEYVKVNFRIKRDLYAEYKKVMIDARTTPTADITRYMMQVVKNYHNSIN